MEDKSVELLASAGSPASTRWNPTKEQISILESLYRQGIRTPTAEQIQQISSRLRMYGHIEGKNVFYWFQNHKARQRQKQKQESMVYANQFFHKAAPVLVHSPRPCNNVVCAPFYMPQTGIGFYPPHPKVLLPGGVKRKPKMDKMEKRKGTGGGGDGVSAGAGYEAAQAGFYNMYKDDDNEGLVGTTDGHHETLTLFPLHPTGVLEDKIENHFPSTSAENSNASTSSGSNSVEVVSADQPLIDFFAENGSVESY
ncbi:PREDICTED: WUSCHEL-related homeobox 2 [Nelumbo nucifera]|uniref:WUSCHEL-related homeobox 2 n=2 Tax=Nelumbo nucifera TaxID=4432 RepID=A0A1U8A1U9_NELNU|nr:PREDICTED: WUSCHEL-related homeobox 2 [Nelumbo nucifera]DAD27759.1 TPA_asm: hypothetical protein HUJ06_029227 [Nelumbo nucifera]